MVVGPVGGGKVRMSVILAKCFSLVLYLVTIALVRVRSIYVKFSII